MALSCVNIPQMFCFMALQTDVLVIDVKNNAKKYDSEPSCGMMKVPLCQFLRWRGKT